MNDVSVSYQMIQEYDLPDEYLYTICRIVGFQPALLLMQQYGGHPLYVPTLEFLRRQDDHELISLLGKDVALMLAEECGGDSVTIPKAKVALMRARDRRMYSRHLSGETIRQLANEHDMHERSVYQAIARHRKTLEVAAERQSRAPESAQGRAPESAHW